MSNLWWKQWQENKRYLAAFMAWMTLGAGYAIALFSSWLAKPLEPTAFRSRLGPVSTGE